LRNPKEGETLVILCFPEAADAELFRFNGFKIPIKGSFQFKPIILMPVKDRNFDYFAQLSKFQVLL